MQPYEPPRAEALPAEPRDAHGPEYEFGPHENAVVWTLAARMRRVGVMQIIAAVLQVVGYTVGFILLSQQHRVLTLGTELPIALAFLVGGFLLLGSASAFRRIVTTQGNDVSHLMSAFDKLSVVMTLLVAAFAVATALWSVSFVLRLLGR
jgi:hypothetical protein